MSRNYTTRREGIVLALTEKLKEIDGSGDFLTNIYGNVSPTLKFWDEIDEFPAVHLNAGSESRIYQGGGFKERYLNISIKVYVKQEEAWKKLGAILEDIETLLEDSLNLQYTDGRGNTCTIQLITVLSIDTDEGVLEPLGVGEMSIEVRY